MVVDEHKYGKLAQIRKNDKDWFRMSNHFYVWSYGYNWSLSAADVWSNLHEHFFLFISLS